MRYFGLTFTDEKYIKTRNRYVAEMESKELFSKIFSYGPEDLDQKFFNRHCEFILRNPRGYGFWIWKPHIIQKVLNEIDDGDILVYGDAGNEMKGTRTECLNKFNLVTQVKHDSKIIAARTHRMFPYMKTDLYFKVRWYGIIYALNKMIEANRIVLQKNYKTLQFIKEWSDLCENDYTNIDNSQPWLPNYWKFIEHRHDQSVFSLLFHIFRCKIVDFDDVWEASRLKY
jgi:hypothetical protein